MKNVDGEEDDAAEEVRDIKVTGRGSPGYVKDAEGAVHDDVAPCGAGGRRNVSLWKGGGQGRAHVSGKHFGMGRKIRRMQRQRQWFQRSGRRLAKEG
jgi:hypothetical protein